MQSVGDTVEQLLTPCQQVPCDGNLLVQSTGAELKGSGSRAICISDTSSKTLSIYSCVIAGKGRSVGS